MYDDPKNHKTHFIEQGRNSFFIIDLVPHKKASCCYKCFCCCCYFCCDKSSSNDIKSYYIDKWKNYLESENKNKDILDPFKVLTDLWGHKNIALQEFYKVRINPNLLLDGFRNDLEFYIPQLCTFLIFGRVDVVEEFLSILCKSCYASFFFTHRVIWFLRSLKNINFGAYEEK